MANVFEVINGYQSRYPHVAVATTRPTGQEEGRPSKAGTAEAVIITLWRFNLG